jgi:hypothetical protein
MNDWMFGPSGNSDSECMTERVIDWAGEWVIEFRHMLGKCITEPMTDWLGEWVGNWVSQRVIDRECNWITEGSCQWWVGEWHQSKPRFNCVLLPLHKSVLPNKQFVRDVAPTIASSPHHHHVTLYRHVYFFLNMKIHSNVLQGKSVIT